jgi:hypothetical protein
MGYYEQWLARASVNKEQCKRGQQLLANATVASSFLSRKGLANFKYGDVHHTFIVD